MMSIKKINKGALYLLVATSLSITACDKDPVEQPVDPVLTKKLVRVAEDANNYTAFDYNANGTLNKMTIASDDGGGAPDIMNITYTYNNQKKAIQLNIAGVLNAKYVYANNKIAKMELYSGNTLAAYDVYTYTGEKITTVEKFLLDNNGSFEADSKEECTYYDNGNLKEVKTFSINGAGQFVFASTRKFLQYDTKKSPFKAIAEVNTGLFLDFYSTNNIALLKTENADASVELTLENSFTYNADGQPKTSTVKTTKNGTTTTTNSSFTYE